MVFSSLSFLYVFLSGMLLVYFLAPVKAKNFVLLLGSLLFYAWGEPVYILIMIFSTVFDYTNGLLIEKYRSENRTGCARAALLVSIVGNMGVLCFFKYGNFVLDNLNSVFGTEIGLLQCALPIGISFYTFQTMSYSIDVYRGEVRAQKNILDFGTYVALFPQLVAGPIIRYKDLASQLKERSFSVGCFAEGVRRFVAGLFKKAVLANSIGYLWGQLSAETPDRLSVATAWIGAAAFTLQIYLDFSGYSDMAVGLGRLFGFQFPENFDFPYRSKSITEFWRRWHISLGTWFREYVYIPLGGSRCGRLKLIRNIVIVWGLTGLWHGASWNFLVWGLYFALILALEKLFLLKYITVMPVWLQHFYTMILVTVSWIIFAFDDVCEGLSYLGVMFGAGGHVPADGQALYYLRSNLLLFAACVLVSVGPARSKRTREPVSSPGRSVFRVVGYALMFACSVIFLVGDSYNPFLYFRF